MPGGIRKNRQLLRNIGGIEKQSFSAPLAPPDMPAQTDLNYWFRTSDDAYLLGFMKDRSPNGIADPTDLASGQRGRMLFADLSAAAIVPNAINGKSSVQMGGQTRLQVSTQRNSAAYAPYYSVSSPFSALTVFKSNTLTATNDYLILPEITGTPAFFQNFAMYALFNAGSPVLVLVSDAYGTINLQVSITATTFNSYSTLYVSYNGAGFSASNFTVRINGFSSTVSASALAAGAGNGGIFFGTANDTFTPTAELLESAMWNKALSAGEISTLSSYTNAEYGLLT